MGPNFRAGEKFLGSLVVTTNSSGNASFNFNSPVLVPAGHFVTSTTSRLNSALQPIDTSEFSSPIIVNPSRGDYNANGTVDAADYVVWRRTQGQAVAPLAGADGNGNGIVDQADYDVWRARFGQSGPAAGTSASLTEVATSAGEAAATTTAVSSASQLELSALRRVAHVTNQHPSHSPARRSDFVRDSIQAASPAGLATSSTAPATDEALLAWLATHAPGDRQFSVASFDSAFSEYIIDDAAIGEDALANGSDLSFEWSELLSSL